MTQKKGSLCQARDCGHLDAASQQCPVTLPPPWTNFWTKRVFQWFCSPHTCLMSPCDFLLFPKIKFHLKGCHLELWTTSKRSWQTSWGHFHMKTSSTATGRGSNVSSGVWLPKGTTLKGIMLIYSSFVNKKCYSTSLITL